MEEKIIVMNEQEADFRIRCLLARGRNIVYYRRIDDRPRGQYIHAVRDYRKDVRNLSLSLPDNEKYKEIKETLKKIVLAIPPKVKSVDCEEYIMAIAEIIMTPEEIRQLPILIISENQEFDE